MPTKQAAAKRETWDIYPKKAQYIGKVHVTKLMFSMVSGRLGLKNEVL